MQPSVIAWDKRLKSHWFIDPLTLLGTRKSFQKTPKRKEISYEATAFSKGLTNNVG